MAHVCCYAVVRVVILFPVVEFCVSGGESTCWQAFCHGQLPCGTGPHYQSVSPYVLRHTVSCLKFGLSYFITFAKPVLFIYEAINNLDHRASNGRMIVE